MPLPFARTALFRSLLLLLFIHRGTAGRSSFGRALPRLYPSGFYLFTATVWLRLPSAARHWFLCCCCRKRFRCPSLVPFTRCWLFVLPYCRTCILYTAARLPDVVLRSVRCSAAATTHSLILRRVLPAAPRLRAALRTGWTVFRAFAHCFTSCSAGVNTATFTAVGPGSAVLPLQCCYHCDSCWDVIPLFILLRLVVHIPR